MVPDGDIPADSEATYDIQLRSRPADHLWARYPTVLVHSTESVTALRRASCPDQLDALLQRMRSVGLVLVDVHCVALAQEDPPGQRAVYEVRVKGVLGEALLQFLRWPHYDVPAETWVRIAAAPDELLEFLRACTAAGAGIERVRRVDWSRTNQPAVA